MLAASVSLLTRTAPGGRGNSRSMFCGACCAGGSAPRANIPCEAGGGVNISGALVVTVGVSVLLTTIARTATGYDTISPVLASRA